MPYLSRRTAQRLDQRARAAAAVDRDHPGLEQELAEHRDPGQFALEDVERVLEEAQKLERLPHRLMLGGDDQRPFRDLLQPSEFDPDVADHPHQEQRGVRPPCGQRHHRPARQHDGRDRDDAERHQHEIEQHVEDERAHEDRQHRIPDKELVWSVHLRGCRPARRLRAGRLKEFRRQVETDLGQPHPHLRRDIFDIFR